MESLISSHNVAWSLTKSRYYGLKYAHGRLHSEKARLDKETDYRGREMDRRG